MSIRNKDGEFIDFLNKTDKLRELILKHPDWPSWLWRGRTQT